MSASKKRANLFTRAHHTEMEGHAQATLADRNRWICLSFDLGVAYLPLLGQRQRIWASLLPTKLWVVCREILP